MADMGRRGFFRAAAVAGAAATGVLAPTAATAAPRIARSEPFGAERVDAVVIGAGLSGLAAAKALRAAGKTVRVVEARGRAGGRVHNVTSGGGRTIDGGAEFIGPTQDRIAALADEFGVRTLKTYNAGDSVYWERGRATRFSAAVPIPPLPGAIEAGVGIAAIDAMCIGFPVGEPWRHPDAAYLDSISWQEWIDRTVNSYTAKSLLAIAESAALSVRPHEVTALYMLNYFAAAGNERTGGSFERLLGTDGGAQERFFVGGAALIPLRLAESMSDAIAYNAPVQAITNTADGVTVHTGARTVEARRAIVAMSPAISGRIDYGPTLSDERRRLHAGTKMGRIAKFTAFYDRPFWREAGMSGQVIGDGTPIDVTFENYADGNWALMGFVSSDAMAQLDDAPEEEFVRRCTDSLVDYFGPRARDFIDYGLMKWDRDPYSWGGPTATTAPGILTSVGRALRDPVGAIHWAGTETADYWTGYMDGAVRSGERAAREVISTLR